MLARPDDIEQQIRMLPAMLAVNVPPYPAKARAAWKKAFAVIAAAEAAHAKITKRHPPPREWEPAPPDVAAAEQAVAVARAEGVRCRLAVNDNLAKREAAFAASALVQLERAAPALVALCRLMESGIEPLIDFQRTAALHGLALPRAFDDVSEIGRGLYAMRRLINRIG